ncbi:hypothetical protein [Christensenella intestinihominis]|uniref:hypothetical protein n=1 Tax=Christensenella intestinihominis TaxID=1851429 RepID=UPI00082D78BD|nr:hypothetical protein [Christensenella intestinihominis]
MTAREAGLRHAPRIDKKYLPLLAGIVWSIAGTAVLSIGFPALLKSPGPLWFSLPVTGIVFFLFFKFIFFRLFRKHTARIEAFPEQKICAFAFFDRKGYIIMACMITFGILLRSSNLLPHAVLGMLYTGIGAAMIGAAASFVVHFIRKQTGIA